MRLGACSVRISMAWLCVFGAACAASAGNGGGTGGSAGGAGGSKTDARAAESGGSGGTSSTGDLTGGSGGSGAAPGGTGGSGGSDDASAPTPDGAPTNDDAAPITSDDASAAPDGAAAGGGPQALWAGLKNPIYGHDGWSVKDVAMVLKDGTYHFFFSAFFVSDGKERCHVAGTSSTDLHTFADAPVLFDGKDGGWAGMCSPDVQKIGAQYVMTFNSWGDLAGKPNQLFYATSPDLVTWSPAKPIGAALTSGNRAIDAAIANDSDNSRLLLSWKDGAGRTRLAAATGLDGPWHLVGNGYPMLLAGGGKDNGKTHENFQFLHIDGKWKLLTTDYEPHEPFVYEMAGTGTAETDWLTWQNGGALTVVKEAFNTDYQANAAYMADWRSYDGYFYLIYAGRTEGSSHAGRGNNTLGLSRSKDLKTWIPAGK